MGQTKANEIGSQDQEQKQCISTYDEIYENENSFCSGCNNRRPKIGLIRDFTYVSATDRYSIENFVSEGGFGSIYKRQLHNGLKIAVKQYKDASLQSEVHIPSKARNKNVVMLLGSCSEGSHRLLMYENVCNGSLDQHLPSMKFSYSEFHSLPSVSLCKH